MVSAQASPLFSIPKFTAEIVGIVVTEFIKELVKLVIDKGDIGSKNDKKESTKSVGNKITYQRCFNLSDNAYIGL